MTAADTEPVVDESPVEPGELVVRDPAAELAQRRDSAVEAAADAALAMPGVPGRDEFLALAMQARILSLSGAAPKEVRNNPYVAFHVAMVGRDLGISPTAALNLIDVITTQSGPQLSLSPQLLNAQIRRLGLGSIRPVVQERDRCIARAFGPDGTVLGETEFTWEDARDAGLVGPRCQPGEHHETTRQRNNGSSYKTCGCNQGYRTYPKRMMWWRAAGFCAADYFPEAGLGLYSPEELGAVVDAEGRPIDPAQVALPAGYDDPADRQREQQQRQQDRQAARDQPGKPEELFELQLHIGALPEKNRKELGEAYKAHQEIRRWRVERMPQRLVSTLRSMVRAHWANATKDGNDRDQCVEAYRRRVAYVVGCITWSGWSPPATEVPRTPDPTPEPEPPRDRTINWAPSAAPGPQEAPDGPSGSDTPEEPATGHTEPESDAEAIDYVAALRDLSGEVRQLSARLPDGLGDRIGRAVRAMHHTTVNKVLADVAELAPLFPPDSPIDYRRMGAVYVLGSTFEETGEVPGVVGEIEAKQQG